MESHKEHASKQQLIEKQCYPALDASDDEVHKYFVSMVDSIHCLHLAVNVAVGKEKK